MRQNDFEGWSVIVTGGASAAGIPMCGKRFHELTLADLDRNIDVNLRGTFLCMRHEIEAMLTHGRGAIVNVASTAAAIGVPRRGLLRQQVRRDGPDPRRGGPYATDQSSNAVLPGST